MGYQIHLIDFRFRHLLSSEAIERRDHTPHYISAPDYTAWTEEDEIGKFAAKLMDARQLAATLVRGPGSGSLDPDPWHLLRILR